MQKTEIKKISLPEKSFSIEMMRDLEKNGQLKDYKDAKDYIFSYFYGLNNPIRLKFKTASNAIHCHLKCRFLNCQTLVCKRTCFELNLYYLQVRQSTDKTK